MIEGYSWNESCEDVETLVRSAGHYVRASEDLRPRVLEAARLQHSEQRVQHCSRQIALFVILLALFTAVGVRQTERESPRLSPMLASAGFDSVFSPLSTTVPRNGDGDWRLIEAFTSLRRQQAQAFRFAL